MLLPYGTCFHAKWSSHIDKYVETLSSTIQTYLSILMPQVSF